MNFFKLLGRVSKVALCASLLSASSVWALDIKLGDVLAPSHSWNVAAKGFADEVKDKTAGRVNFVLFPSSQLGSEKTMLEGMQIGAVDAGIIGSSSLQQFSPKFGVIDLPYAWPTPQTAYRALDGELGAALAKIAATKNMVILSWWELGYRHVTNNRRAIKEPADLKGLKIRVAPDKVRLDTFTALGASPAPLAFGELYSALQQGVFDAQENPLSVIYTSSFFEVQKHLSLTGHIWGAACLIVSKPVWNKISDADKAVVTTAAAKWRDAQRKMVQDSDDDYIAKLKEKGMIVNTVDKAAFIKAVEPVWKKYEPVFGADMMGLVKKYQD
ncbi:DctP family TRAP transporter solute-binding subunit [Paralcaligenes ureilyticus]|uniref:Tripartite ATP-independent transporter DctP family solute receptor n=1 Tax=Paralcaligenes ureilyticus TaxID=627131 RepID=A0A4R3LSB4_9BURK|nr:DctP family TRAP transporter solute-binding subunit [Paralcaligenes ureilyticus]TCT03360.1 tripartite ATP-independent transporter DctP family solute receptor [Paralcaligenes ureilyticus]